MYIITCVVLLWVHGSSLNSHFLSHSLALSFTHPLTHSRTHARMHALPLYLNHYHTTSLPLSLIVPPGQEQCARPATATATIPVAATHPVDAPNPVDALHTRVVCFRARLQPASAAMDDQIGSSLGWSIAVCMRAENLDGWSCLAIICPTLQSVLVVVFFMFFSKKSTRALEGAHSACLSLSDVVCAVRCMCCATSIPKQCRVRCAAARATCVHCALRCALRR